MRFPIPLIAALASATLFAPGPRHDFATLPPEPAALHAELAALPVSLRDALGRAEAIHPDGRIADVHFSNGVFAFDVFTPSEHRRIEVDGETGEVLVDRPEPGLPGRQAASWVELPSGLRYADIVEGSGAQPAGDTSTVEVHFSGWLVDGRKFDCSRDRGTPSRFELRTAIRGLTEGIGGMRVGGLRKLIVPYDLGFGVAGSGSIPS